MRFAVHGPGIPVASPRSHGVSRRDVDGRVHVSVAGVSAGSAHESRLALARPRIHVPARRASLTSKSGIDPLDPTGRFLLQTMYQQTPTRTQDAPIQHGFLADVAAWVRRALSGSGHVLDPEILDLDRVEAACDVRAGLLDPILTPIRLPGPDLRNRQAHPSTGSGAAPGASELTFQSPQPGLLPLVKAWNMQQFPGGQGRRDGYAPVDAHGLAVAGCRDRRGNGSEGEMPTTRPVHPHSIRLHAYGYGARPPETYPSSLRYPHLSNLAGQAAHVPLVAAPHNPESFIPPGFAPRRPSGRILRVEECGCRLSKVSQGLLLHRLGACTQPVMLGSGFGELPRLLQVARRACTARAPVLMLLHGEIPHIPSMGAVVQQHRHLGGRGKQPVLGHANTLATTSDNCREVKRRFLPFAMTEGSAPGTR